jgi:hypothetical protein
MAARAAHLCLRLSLLLSLVSLSGCFERSLVPIAPCTRSRVAENIDVEGVEDVDLLLVVDDSNSMAEEQSQLIAQLPRLVEVLATGDRGLDGTVDFRAARTIHVGIISTDMGVGVASGEGLEHCASGNGDDGLLVSSTATCSGTGASGSVFDFAAGADAVTFASTVGCVANLGTNGCGYEQQLEAMLKGLSPAGPETWTADGYVPPVFLSGTGHSGIGGPNAGFIRDDSVLAVIMVTDEDDCSASDSSIFEVGDPRYTSAVPNLRCSAFADRLHSVQRYVEGLIALRRRPSLVVFGAITGIPVSAEGLPLRDVLNLPEMDEHPDPARPTQLAVACRGPLQTVGAFPARRIVEVAAGLEEAGAGATVHSICGDTFEHALDEIVASLADVLQGACLPHPLNPDAEGRVGCIVQEVLPAIETGAPTRTRCSALPGDGARTRVGEEVEVVNGVTLHHEVCEVRGLPRSAIGIEAGWYYDDGTTAGSDVAASCGSDTERGQRISFSLISPTTGAEIRLVCDQTVPPGEGAPIGIGTFCEPEAEHDRCTEGRAPDHVTPLACDRFQRTCELPCSDSSMCNGAGLGGHVCDPRTATEIYGERLPPAIDADAIHGFCVSPTCDD